MSARLARKIAYMIDMELTCMADAIEWQALDAECSERASKMEKPAPELLEWGNHIQAVVGKVLSSYEQSLHDVFLLSTSDWAKRVQEPVILMALWICADWKIKPPVWLHEPVCELVWSQLIFGQYSPMARKARSNVQYHREQKLGGPHTNPLKKMDDFRQAIYSFYTVCGANVMVDEYSLKFQQGESINSLVAQFLGLSNKGLRQRVSRAAEFLGRVLATSSPQASFNDMLIFRVRLKELQQLLIESSL